MKLPELEILSNNEKLDKFKPRRYKIYWGFTFLLSYFYLAGLIGIWYHLTLQSDVRTLIWAFVHATIGLLGTTAGLHRLWAHKCYKANTPLRIILMIMTTFSWSKSIYSWARDHRVHHKYSETDADPHNAKRGFFYAHVGWFLVKKHPEVIEKGKCVDVSDLKQDKIVMFQKQYYYWLVCVNGLLLPTIVPIYFWAEDPWISWFGASCLSIIFSGNVQMLVNSAAHLWGPKPYDKNIGPTESLLAIAVSLGEGFHNYHHTFPWDYKASEYGWDVRNMTTVMINMFAKLGWAYELKEATPEMIRKRVARTGDGSWNGDLSNIKEYFAFHYNHDDDKEKVWGWGDENMPKEDVNDMKISHRLI